LIGQPKIQTIVLWILDADGLGFAIAGQQTFCRQRPVKNGVDKIDTFDQKHFIRFEGLIVEAPQ